MMKVIAFSKAHCAVRFDLERNDHAAWAAAHYPEAPLIDAIESWVQGAAKESTLPNRAARRALAVTERQALRARLKFDKLVTPQGPKPVKQERSAVPKPTPKPKPASSEVAPIETDDAAPVIDYYDLNPENPEVLYEQSEFVGQFNFRDTILDQLERYWFYLDRMRHHDADAFGFYKQVGMHLVPHAATGAMGKSEDVPDSEPKEVCLPSIFNASRPSFGCVAYGVNSKIEEWEQGSKKIWPRFMYYTKLAEPPPTIQRINVRGDIYKMTVWWDTKESSKQKWGVPNDFIVLIDETGNQIIVLKTCKTRMIPIRMKRKLGEFQIPDRSWRIPHDYEKWANSHGLNVQTHLGGLFAEAAKLVETAQSGDVRVAVHKGDLTAVFNINARRMAYFFQDRDYNLTENGARRKVFHVVQSHTRVDGAVVKTHYRGEKKFTWAGYAIEVTVPGLDHFTEHEFNVGAVDEYWVDPADKKKLICAPELGAHLVQWMRDGVGKPQ